MIFALNYKFNNKNDHVCAWRDFNSTSCILSTYRYPKGPDTIYNLHRYLIGILKDQRVEAMCKMQMQVFNGAWDEEGVYFYQVSF